MYVRLQRCHIRGVSLSRILSVPLTVEIHTLMDLRCHNDILLIWLLNP